MDPYATDESTDDTTDEEKETTDVVAKIRRRRCAQWRPQASSAVHRV